MVSWLSFFISPTLIPLVSWQNCLVQMTPQSDPTAAAEQATQPGSSSSTRGWWLPLLYDPFHSSWDCGAYSRHLNFNDATSRCHFQFFATSHHPPLSPANSILSCDLTSTSSSTRFPCWLVGLVCVSVCDWGKHRYPEIRRIECSYTPTSIWKKRFVGWVTVFYLKCNSCRRGDSVPVHPPPNYPSRATHILCRLCTGEDTLTALTWLDWLVEWGISSLALVFIMNCT